MRICLDGRWIFRDLTGIGIYTRELLRHLLQEDKANCYVILFDDEEVQKRTLRFCQADAHPAVEAVLIPYGPFSPTGQFRLARLLQRLRIDVYHSPNYLIPLLAFSHRRPNHPRCIATVHDLIPLVVPDHAPKARKARLLPVFRALLKAVANRADCVLTVSESSRRDVISQLKLSGSNAKRVEAILEAAGEHFVPGPPVRDPVILFVGRRDPYKNLPLLVQAFAQVRQTIPEARLRVVGPSDERYPEAEQQAAELGLDESVDWLGSVDLNGLIEAYATARVFVLPTRYEGFGLTVLEAMQSGVPVICSNVASLPEVAGTAAILLEPGDSDALTRALLKVLTDEGVYVQMREAGLQQASRFSWARTARETLDLYIKLGAAS